MKFYRKFTDQKDTNLKALISGVFNSLLFKILGMIVGYVLTIFITNNYGASAYGTLTLLLAITGVFAVIPRFGLDDSLIRIVSGLKTVNLSSDISLVIKIMIPFVILMGSLFSASLYFLAGDISNKILDKDIGSLIRSCSVLVVILASTAIASAFFQGMGKIKTFSFLDFTLQPSIFLLLLFFYDAEYSLHNLVNLAILASIIHLILVFLLLMLSVFSLRVSYFEYSKTKKEYFKKIIRISFPMLITASFLIIIQWTDVIMLGMFVPESDIGIYHVAQKLTISAGLLLSASCVVIAPKITELYALGSMKALEVFTMQSAKLIFFLSLPIILILIIFASFILSLFGAEFILGTTVLIIMAVSQLVNISTGAVGELLNMTNYQKTKQRIVFASALINILLNFILIPFYGIEGAAFSTMVCMIFWNVAMILKVKEKLGFWAFYIPGIYINR